MLRAAPLLEKAMAKLGVTVLVIAPIGGVLGAGAKATIVKRTAATARSIEFDALLVAGGTSVTGDIKQTILLHEVFRQCKAIGAWGDGAAVLQAAGIDVSGPGVLVGAALDKTFTGPLVLALGLHRVWERTDLVMPPRFRPQHRKQLGGKGAPGPSAKSGPRSAA